MPFAKRSTCICCSNVLGCLTSPVEPPPLCRFISSSMRGFSRSSVGSPMQSLHACKLVHSSPFTSRKTYGPQQFSKQTLGQDLLVSSIYSTMVSVTLLEKQLGLSCTIDTQHDTEYKYLKHIKQETYLLCTLLSVLIVLHFTFFSKFGNIVPPDPWFIAFVG